MPDPTVESLLARFSPDNTTVKLVTTLLGAIPGTPEFLFYSSMEEAQFLVAPDLDEEGMARAKALLSSPEFLSALKVADALDTSDIGISVFTGLRSAFNFFFGDKKKALETDAQQGADAVLKAAGIAWMTHRFYTGSVSEKIQKLQSTPAGKTLLVWFAAVEICLPFADDVALGTGHFLSNLMDKYSSHLSRLDSLTGAPSKEAATGILSGLSAPLEEIIQAVSQHTKTIAESSKSYLPAAFTTADTVAGAVATAADAMPVYRLLAARLAIEAALIQAAKPV